MQRIVVAGGPGNGKSTLASALAAQLGLVHIELDALFHRPGWESASEEEFRSGLVVAMDAAPQGWVTCGNYISLCGNLHIERADTLVWLDLPRGLVTRRVAWRTVRRAATGERLFGQDIREPLRNFVRWAPEKNIIRWAWHHHGLYAVKYARHLAKPEWAHLDVHHFQTVEEIEAFLASAIPPGDDGSHR